MFANLGCSDVLQFKLAGQIIEDRIGLLLAQDAMDLCEVRGGVHGFEPVGFAQGSDGSVGADQEFELLDEFFGDQGIEFISCPDKTIRRKRFELFGIDAWDQRAVDLLGLDHLQHAGEFQHRKAARQQVSIEHVAGIDQRHFSRGCDAEQIRREFLPIEGQARDIGEPLQDIRPSLVAVLELQHPLFVGLDIKGPGRGSRFGFRGTLDRLSFFVGRVASPFARRCVGFGRVGIARWTLTLLCGLGLLCGQLLIGVLAVGSTAREAHRSN